MSEVLLKTLKDLSIQNAPMSEYNTTIIRQEAIKHIKAINKGTEGKAWYEEGYTVKGKDMLVGWIKDFFNITEDDLELSDNSANQKVEK